MDPWNESLWTLESEPAFQKHGSKPKVREKENFLGKLGEKGLIDTYFSREHADISRKYSWEKITIYRVSFDIENNRGEFLDQRRPKTIHFRT